MSPPPAKTLSPQELAKLESAFNSDPGSDAYRPLAEAYLGRRPLHGSDGGLQEGREGASQPPRPAPAARARLRRAGQGQEGARGAAGRPRRGADRPRSAPRARRVCSCAPATRRRGRPPCRRSGRWTRRTPRPPRLFAQWKVEPPRPPPPPEPPPAPASATVGGTRSAPSPSLGGAPRHGHRAAGAAPRTRSVNGMPGAADRPARIRAGGRRGLVGPGQEGPRHPLRHHRRGRGGDHRRLVRLGSVEGRPRHQAEEEPQGGQRAAPARQLRLVQEGHRRGRGGAGHRPQQRAAHGYLAYAYAIRWGEHGDGDDARRFAEEHLASVRRLGDQDSRFADAAEALLAAYAGKGTQALATLETKVKALDEKGQTSAFLKLTQGIIQMQLGDLEARPRQPGEGTAGGAQRSRGCTRPWGRSTGGGATPAPRTRTTASPSATRRTTPSRCSAGRSWRSTRTAPAGFRPRPPSASRSCSTPTRRRPPDSWQWPTSRRPCSSPGSRWHVPGSRRPTQRSWPRPRASRTTGPRPLRSSTKEDEEGFALDRNNPELHLLRGKRLLVERTAGRRDPRDARGGEGRPEPRPGLRRPRAGADAEARGSARCTGGAHHRHPDHGREPPADGDAGQVYFRQGRLDEAAAQYTKALADGKTKNPEARLQLGVVYREKKDYPRAVEQLTRASQEFIGQSSRIAEALTSLAAPTRPRETAPGPTRPTAGRWTPTRPTPTPTSSTPGSSAQTGAAARRPGSPRRSTSSSTRAASTPPMPRPSPAEGWGTAGPGRGL